MVAAGNIFADSGTDHDPARERFETLLAAPGLKIERIVSRGQSSPPGFWYDQPEGEWVLLLSGGATLEFEGVAASHRMAPGDYVWIPPRRRHRVAATPADQVTVWLAVHHGAD